MGAHLENTKRKNPGLWRRLGPWVMMARQAALFSGGPLSGPVPSLHLHRTWGGGSKAEPCFRVTELVHLGHSSGHPDTHQSRCPDPSLP